MLSLKVGGMVELKIDGSIPRNFDCGSIIALPNWLGNGFFIVLSRDFQKNEIIVKYFKTIEELETFRCESYMSGQLAESFKNKIDTNK